MVKVCVCGNEMSFLALYLFLSLWTSTASWQPEWANERSKYNLSHKLNFKAKLQIVPSYRALFSLFCLAHTLFVANFANLILSFVLCLRLQHFSCTWICHFSTSNPVLGTLFIAAAVILFEIVCTCVVNACKGYKRHQLHLADKRCRYRAPG